MAFPSDDPIQEVWAQAASGFPHLYGVAAPYTLDLLRQALTDGIDRIIESPWLSKFMTDDQIRLLVAQKQLWNTNNDALAALLAIINGG